MTVTESEDVPPAPVHESVKVLVLLRAAVASLPDIPLEPLQASEAVQLVAFVVLHVSIDVAPVLIDIGLAVRSTVGAAGGGGVEPFTVTVTERWVVPPPPVQLRL